MVVVALVQGEEIPCNGNAPRDLHPLRQNQTLILIILDQDHIAGGALGADAPRDIDVAGAIVGGCHPLGRAPVRADPDVVADMELVLDRVVPWEGGYRHMEGNTAAHVKGSMMGSSVQVLLQTGKICLGTWQGIYFCEFDGPRTRKVWMNLLETSL